MKAEKVTAARQHLGCCKDECEVFLWRIGTDDETQAHPYNPENKIPYFSIDNARVIYTKKV
jgi:hypothetical protein